MKDFRTDKSWHLLLEISGASVFEIGMNDRMKRSRRSHYSTKPSFCHSYRWLRTRIYSFNFLLIHFLNTEIPSTHSLSPLTKRSVVRMNSAMLLFWMYWCRQQMMFAFLDKHTSSTVFPPSRRIPCQGILMEPVLFLWFHPVNQNLPAIMAFVCRLITG